MREEGQEGAGRSQPEAPSSVCSQAEPAAAGRSLWLGWAFL